MDCMKRILVAMVIGFQWMVAPSFVYGAAADLSSPVLFDGRVSSSANAGICRVLAHALESKRLQLRTLEREVSSTGLEVQFSGLVQTGSLEEAPRVDEVMSQHLRARLAIYASEREYFDGLCVALSPH